MNRLTVPVLIVLGILACAFLVGTSDFEEAQREEAARYFNHAKETTDAAQIP